MSLKTLKPKVAELIEMAQNEGGLPDWDDDSPIIASGYGYEGFTSMKWEVTEKGTMRWRHNPEGSGVGDYTHSASWGNTLNERSQPDEYQKVAYKVKQIDLGEGIYVIHMGYTPKCERIRFVNELDECYLQNFNSIEEIDYTRITKIKINNNVAIEKIELLPSITTLDSYGFHCLINLKEINLDNITKFDQSCLYSTRMLNTDIVFNAGLVYIDSNAFQYSGIKSIVFQEPTTGSYPSIATNSFGGCSKLTSVTIPSGWDANFYFSGCPLTQECLHTVIENLADLTDLTAKNFTVGTANIKKLDEEHITMLENKNWNYS